MTPCTFFRCAPFCLLFAAVTLHAQGGPAPATRLGLQESIRRAIDHSRQVESVELAVQGSELQIQQARNARFLPSFTMENYSGVLPRRRAVKADGTPGTPGEADYLTSPDTSTGFGDLRPFTQTEIKFIQPLYTFGKLKNTELAARHGRSAAEAKKSQTEDELALKMTQLYWGMVLVKELFTLSDDARQKMISAEATIQEKLDADDEDVSQQDLWKLRIFTFEVNTHHEEVLKQQALLRTTYALLTGLPESDAWDVDLDNMKPVEAVLVPFEAVLARALEQRPELLQLRAGLHASRANVNIQKAGYYPDVFLAGGLSQNYAKDRYDPDNPFLYNPTNYFRPGAVLGMKMNLNFHMTHKKQQEAEVKRLIVEEQLQAAEQGITIEVRDAWLSLRAALANVEHGDKARRDGERWQQSAAQIWDAGLGETKDLIDAYKTNGEMQAKYLQAVFELNVAAAKLEKTIGDRTW